MTPTAANISFAAIAIGMVFAWFELPAPAALAFCVAFVANLVDMGRNWR